MKIPQGNDTNRRFKELQASVFLNPFGGVNVSGGMGEKKEAVIFQCLVMRVVSEEKGD